MFSLLLLGPLTAAASLVQAPAPIESSLTAKRTIEAVKITAPPKIDGDLSDECWRLAPMVSDFVTNQPEFGKASALRTEVKIVYDDNAIYVGAHMYDGTPEKIMHQLCERDGQANADNFAVGFDTYNDNLNGYRFQVSACGVQTDGRLSPGNYDLSWDAVWFSRVSIVNDGWVAELKIPYSALRFPKQDIQSWGLQFARVIQRYNELSSWSPVNPQIDGTVNQWGELSNLQKLHPPLRLSFIPYLTVGFQRQPLSLDPKVMANGKILNGGMDINWGINESFTLNTTLIPDFGQVQSDNLVLNLSPFEVQFQERRPFFTEGTELFNRKVGLGPGQLFYSRRIGQTPSLYYDVPYLVDENEEVVSNPSVTQLYNATKFSGRTKGDLGIGMINAVSAPMYAVVKNSVTGEKRKVLTEPLANYNIFVLDQSLKNNSRVGFINTSVIRKGDWRKANVSSLNFVIKDPTNTFSWSGVGSFSQIYDNAIADKPQFGAYVDYQASKISGNFRFDFEQWVITDKYDQNDLGLLFHGNEVANFIGFKYFDFKPKKKINNWSSSIGVVQTSLFKPFAFQDFTINMSVDWQFTNFWYMGAFATTKPVRYYDYYEPRVEGAKFCRYPYGYMNMYVGTDTRKVFSTEVILGFGESPVKNDPYFEATITPTVRIKDRIKISHSFNWSRDFKNYGFADFDDEGRPVIGGRQLFTVSNTFNFQYTITPLMYMTLRARHYWSKAVYIEHATLDAGGYMDFINYPYNTDRNFNTWNIDFIYNWQFAPGSNMILTWKQSIAKGDRDSGDNYYRNVQRTFNTPQSNSISVKVQYYLDYQQMREWDEKRKMRKHNLG